MKEKVINDEIIYGALALSPILLVISSAAAGLGSALVIFITSAITMLFFYGIRQVIPLSQRLVVLLTVISVFALMATMVIEAQFYSFSEKIGLFFPLLLINSLVLTVNESVFTCSDIKIVIKRSLFYGIFILVFFSVFGLLRELFGSLALFSDINLLMQTEFTGFSLSHHVQGLLIFNSAAGSFFILGAIFAMINLVKNKNNNIGSNSE